MVEASKFVRRWHQFSLRTLLLFVFVCALGCSWLATRLQRADRQRRAVAALRNQWHGFVEYEDRSHDKPSAGSRLQTLLVDDFFNPVVRVDMMGRGTDAATVPLDDLPALEMVSFDSSSQLTDAGLVNLRRARRLFSLDLANTAVAGDGLAHLEDLPHLQILVLRGSRVNDAAMKHIQRMRGLVVLDLSKTGITGAGLSLLEGLGELKTLELSYTAIGDADLASLRGMSKLRRLDLCDARHVTDAGLRLLADLASLELLDLSGTGVTDAGLCQLAKLARLRWVGLQRTAVTAPAAARLHQSLPGCRID